MKKSSLTGWHKPFVIPRNIPEDGQVKYCLGIVEKYRAETILLRRECNQLRECKKKVAEQEKEIENLKRLIKEKGLLIEEMEKTHEAFEKLIEKYKRQRDMYRGMVFKPNKKKSVVSLSKKGKKRGGQVGHKGYSRRRPKADVTKRVYAVCCPSCDGKLSRSESFTTHTVEDIPQLLKLHTVVTEYQTERQWCSTCKKEVRAVAPGVIPHSRFGINLIVTGMLSKYGMQTPINKIVFLYKNLFGIKLSEGGFVNLLHRAKGWLGPYYEQIRTEVKTARVKHADETGWRIEGVGNWIWAFLSSQSVYYRVEETRGKGVPEEEFQDAHERDILVRDDYRAYQKLKLLHQSCWAHLLRKSREAANADSATVEVKRLHRRLKSMYDELKEIVDRDFKLQERRRAHKQKWEQLKKIMKKRYKDERAEAIQTRIVNQGKNLLTALLYEGVPLTNNHAERNIRNFVVMRKVSGGSKTMSGARTHAVNMSVLQTLKMRKEPLVTALQEKILDGATVKL